MVTPPARPLRRIARRLAPLAPLLLLGACVADGGGSGPVPGGIRPILSIERSGLSKEWQQVAALDGPPVGFQVPQMKVIRIPARAPGVFSLPAAGSGRANASAAARMRSTLPRLGGDSVGVPDGDFVLPVEEAILTSGYGVREHPILGIERAHAGIDLAAPTGTPVMASAAGVIDAAGVNGGYGNYIRVRHAGTTSTAYAHLSRFAPGVAPGVAVAQGQVIGYVGSTGMSTGPHLHWEVLVGNQPTDPLRVMPAEVRVALSKADSPVRLVAELPAGPGRR